MFERLMVAYEVQRDRWAFKGRFLSWHPIWLERLRRHMHQWMQLMQVHDKLKETILRRYDISEESYRQRFCDVKENPIEN